MTPPVERLHTATDIRAVFAARNVAHGSAMSVHVRHRHDGGPSRATVIAGRRAGGAVLRNRAKRRLRAIVNGVQLPEAADVIVVAGSAAVSAAQPELRCQLETLLERLARRGEAAA